MNKQKTVILLVVLLLAVFAGVNWYTSPSQKMARDNALARATIETFGHRLKNVSLVEDGTTVDRAIEENYGPYITSDLLTDWKINHVHAPGQKTASLTPDGMSITAMREQGESRVVTGNVLLVTEGAHEGDPIGTVPFIAQLIPTRTGWRIAVYQEEIAPSTSTAGERR